MRVTQRSGSGWGFVFGGLLIPAMALTVVGLAIGCRAPSARAAGVEADLAPPPEIAAAFPLVAKPGQRYLEDSTGTPFLIHGDTAWSLIAQLTREEVELYLEDRRTRGFNTILVNLIEHEFATNAPANIYSQEPFLVPEDYSTPNEAYFAHADWVVRQAAEKGILVLLTPSYLGSGGSGQGWYKAMVANGPDRLRQYGEYLGRRYHKFSNILWVHAGDYNPPRKDLVRAIAEGIREIDPRALHSAHGGRDTVALNYWEGESWLQVNNIYTARQKSWSDNPVYAAALKQFARPERMPFFLIEGVYENEHEADERHLRSQAYQAVLSGAAGQVFGNNPIWYFDGRGLYSAPVTWQEALGSSGAHSMTHLHNLLTSVPWWLLEPDTDKMLVTDGLSSGGERAVAARTADRSLAIIHLPSSREITVDLGELAGPRVAARWYDPANGRFSTANGSPFQASGAGRFGRDLGANSSGFDDWVLVLESQS